MLPARWQTPWLIQKVQKNILEVFRSFLFIFDQFPGNIPSESAGGSFIQAGLFIRHYTVIHLINKCRKIRMSLPLEWHAQWKTVPIRKNTIYKISDLLYQPADTCPIITAKKLESRAFTEGSPWLNNTGEHAWIPQNCHLRIKVTTKIVVLASSKYTWENPKLLV